ncbi:MAG: hypothetical protein QXT64_01875 [Desulfurococcaceae archaeon]
MLSNSLNWLLLTCKPRDRRCILGYYILSNKIVGWRSIKKALDEDTIVLSAISTKIKKERALLISFEVKKIPLEPPIKPLPVDISTCIPGVCIDGAPVRIGDYRSYIYDRFALTYRESLDGYYYGNLFLRGSIPSIGWLTRWKSRRAISKALKQM